MENNFDDDFQIGPESLGFYRSERTSQTFRFFLDQEIRQPIYYRELIQCLTTAQEGDVVELFINSCGGSLSSTGAILTAIENSDALVVAILMGDCFSAATMIALGCHHIVTTDYTRFMVHSASYGTGGKARDVKGFVEYSDEMLRRVFFKAYEGFYNKEEMERILDGHEDWLKPEELDARLEARQKYFEEKEKQEQSPAPVVRKSRKKKVDMDTEV